ncbi:hypothetical protein EV426DRAFT_706577 [Tirmania nivea]|nr:hypothetical protein EV426DRAFT_706577 [Tirmania nivea]
MVTGAETAGIVLGAFPLVIEGLKVYIKGVSTMRDMKRYEFILGQFKRDIEMESTHFEDTCYQLLQHMALPEDVTLDKLMANPGGNLWKTEELQHALLRRLRPGSAMQFMRAAEELKCIMYTLGEKFPSKSPDFCDEKAHRKAMRKFQKMLDVAFGKDYRQEKLTRIRQLNKDLRLLVTGVHVIDLEVPLKPAISHGNNPASKYQQIKAHAIEVYDLMREKFQNSLCECEVPHTASLQLQVRSTGAPEPTDQSLRFQLVFDALMKPEALGWREMEFECMDEHSMPPHPQQITQQNPLDLSEIQHGNSKFNDQVQARQMPPVLSPAIPDFTPYSADLITVQETLENSEAGLDLHTGSLRSAIKSKSGERVIQALHKKVKFLAVSREQSTSRPVCPDESGMGRGYSQRQSCNVNETRNGGERTPSSLGIINCLCSAIKAARGWECHSCLGLLVSGEGNIYHKLWLPKQSWLSFQPDKHVTLDDLFDSSLPVPSTKLRLKLALKLASSVLQLHDSCWLNEIWGRKDIFFVQGPDGPVIDKPLIYRVFPHKSSQPKDTPLSTDQEVFDWPLLCNRSIFCLGITLIELWHWKSIDQLQEAPVGYENGFLGALEVLNAQRMVPDLFDTAGVAYGMAVRGCIMGLPSDRKPDPRLEREDFKNEVYRKIVCPLEDHLKHFCNEHNVERIFD